MRAKLTDTAIRSYEPRPAQYSIGDASCPGLCIRITPNGIKTFAFAYRNKIAHKVEWLTVGRYPDLPLVEARQLANDARKVVAQGGAPQAIKRRRVEAQKKTKTYAEVVELYYEAKLSALRTGHHTRRMLQRVGRVYSWNERPLTSKMPSNAEKAMANRTKHIVHAMFKCAKQPGRKFATMNPFADLPAPGGAATKRDRFLSPDEIRRVWRALDEPSRFNVPGDAATALRLILVTAARPGMVRGMVGSELRDLNGPSEHGPHWSLPGQRMKARTPLRRDPKSTMGAAACAPQRFNAICPCDRWPVPVSLNARARGMRIGSSTGWWKPSPSSGGFRTSALARPSSKVRGRRSTPPTRLPTGSIRRTGARRRLGQVGASWRRVAPRSKPDGRGAGLAGPGAGERPRDRGPGSARMGLLPGVRQAVAPHAAPEGMEPDDVLQGRGQRLAADRRPPQ